MDGVIKELKAKLGDVEMEMYVNDCCWSWSTERLGVHCLVY